ncbi:Crp/Fnr family transcriptional regulator [soil metagenome]
MKFRNYFLSALTSVDFSTIAPLISEQSLSAGEILYQPGEPVPHVYLPSTTVLSVMTVMRNGDRVESSTIGRESATGLLNALSGTPSSSLVLAQIAGSAMKIAARPLRDLALASPTLMALVARHIQANVAQVEQSVACNAVHHVDARLARWLLQTVDRVGAPVVPLTQEYLAIMLGVQRTTVSVSAAALKAGGLIRYARGRVEVTDRPGLEHKACECYGVCRTLFDNLLPADEDVENVA